MKLLYIYLLFVAPIFLAAQTATVTIDILGSSQPLCNNPSPGNTSGQYGCVNADNWYFTGDEFYTFSDPIPDGNIITEIEVILRNTNCDGSGYIEIENTGGDLMFMLTGTDCSNSSNTCQDIAVSDQVIVTEADYNYGGTNTFDIMTTGAPICMTHVDLVFTYEPAAEPIPTLSQWGIIVLSLILLITGVSFARQRKSVFNLS